MFEIDPDLLLLILAFLATVVFGLWMYLKSPRKFLTYYERLDEVQNPRMEDEN